MEHYGEQSDRKCKAKCIAIEMEVLVEEANKHVVERQQRNINITQRNLTWERFCEKVNPVGKTKKINRWQEVRRRTKEKNSS